MADIKTLRMAEENGTLPAYAWPGGYPLVYFCEDGGELCPKCANGENGSEASETSDDPQWKLIGGDVYWEGPPIQCAQCNADIESAYGEPEGEAEEYRILLTTGGPALRIIGALGRYNEPDSARLEWQDWGTPWTEYETSYEDDKILAAFASQFYFGER